MSPSDKHLRSDGLLRFRQQWMEHAVLIDKALSYYPCWYQNSRTDTAPRLQHLVKDSPDGGFDAYETRKMQFYSHVYICIHSSIHSFMDKQILIEHFAELWKYKKEENQHGPCPHARYFVQI